MDTIAEVMRSAARVAGDGRGRLNAPRALQSWPGIVHGGGVVALLDAAASGHGPRFLEGRLTASLPSDTDLDLETLVDQDATTLTVRRGGHVLSSGVVRALEAAAIAPAPTDAPRWRGEETGMALPVSDDCLACGAVNPLGLRIGLLFDERGVWGRLTPSDAWRIDGGRVHAALVPVLLDEIAWWLGALVSREGGLTNRISVTFRAAEPPLAEPLVAAGRFADVTSIDRRGVFWRTETALLTESGALVATASIVFRGGAEYSARQLPYFRSRTPADVFRRMFPGHAS